ncbi:hypothetical protein FOMA001_g2173 [Fusarium oxysporum f. sp. matthiolae]|nr:hypothetical protein FOMA001_g2173 [Fusarium oxysporum f. sp. matthiolae]
MSSFTRRIRFEGEEDGQPYFADLGSDFDRLPVPGAKLGAFRSIDGLANKTKAKTLSIPSYPPLWTKPPASIAHPSEDIPVNDFCAKSLLDYEGELVLVISKECRDVTPEDARDYILGYTVGNDLSCRLFQLPRNSGGQFFFAKAFDKFAPIGPTLISPEVFASSPSFTVITRVNGEIRQEADL